MSEIPFSLLLRGEIMALDAQVERECAPRGTTGLHALCWPAESARLLKAYYTGTVECCDLPSGYIQPAYSLEMMVRDWVRYCNPSKAMPEKRRGRPRKVSCQAQRHLLCGERQARRLAASGKARQRHRQAPNTDMQRMLELHARREALVQEMKKLDVIDRLASEIDQMIMDWIPVRDWRRRAQFRKVLEKMVRSLGQQAAAVAFAFARGRGLRHAAEILSLSTATLSRRLSARLPDLRRQGESLRELAHSSFSSLPLDLPPRTRRAVTDDESAWDKQTRSIEATRPKKGPKKARTARA